jgi:hypothetical protein
MQLTAPRGPAIIPLPGCDPVHARDARRRARVILAGWGLGEQASLGELVASELLANAVRHGQPPVWMMLALNGGVLRVEVHDGGGGLPVRRYPGSGDERGRGLELLDTLTGLHGGERGLISDPAGPGKTVYVAVSLQPSPGTPAAAGSRPGTCPHLPACPPPQARDCLAARVVAHRDEQGWSLLCNGVVAFDDTGALLPDGSAVSPDATTGPGCHPGISQAGHARTVVPVLPGRARPAGLRRPDPAMTGAALATHPRTCPTPAQAGVPLAVDAVVTGDEAGGNS